MKLALNGATIMRSPLADDVEIAASCGFAALEVWAGKLGPYLEQRSLAGLRASMQALGIAASCINSIEDITFRDAEGRAALRRDVAEMAATARAIGAPAIVVVPGRRPEGSSRSASIREAVASLRVMSDISGDVALAFEFLGKPGSCVPTLDMANEIIGQVDRPNVGMVVDTFHFYAGGSRIEDLRHALLDRLLVVHLNGCEDRPRGELADEHRLYPGEGVIPIRSILATLRERAYDGTFSVEMFRPQYWEQDARIVARTAFERAWAVLANAGYARGFSRAENGGARAAPGAEAQD